MRKLVNAFILSVFFLCFMGAGLSFQILTTITISDGSTGGDCALVGTWDDVTNTCTLTTDLNFAIEGWGSKAIRILDPGITLDGNGHTMFGFGPSSQQWGVAIYSDITVKNLKITDFSYPIVTGYLANEIEHQYVGNNKIIGNTFSNSVWALNMWSSDNLIENNIIDTASIGGIALEYDNQIVRNNNIINCWFGVFFAIPGGQVSSNNLIYNNNFIGNGYDVTENYGYPGVNNRLNLDKPIGGNYYDRHDTSAEGCNDADSDGFCDAAYELETGIQDNLPWAKMNGWLDIKSYKYGGILQPINAEGDSIFKLGSTVPVKFQLKDYNGNYVRNAVAKIYVAKLTNAIWGDELEAGSTSAATTGNLFRYDTTAEQYIFNLGTKTLSAGTWQIRIELDDGTSKYVQISLKK